MSQMVAIIAALTFEYAISLDASLGWGLLNGLPADILRIIYCIAIWFSTVMTVVSGAVYLYENREFIKN